MLWRRIFIPAVSAFMLSFGSSSTLAYQTIKTSVDAVTVFPSCAQITRTAKLELPPGEHSLLIEGIPELADVESFRASVSGVDGITILGLRQWTVSHTEAPQKRVAELSREIELYENSVKQAVADRLDAFDRQKALLTTMSQETGQNMTGDLKTGAFDVGQWESAFGFLGEKTRLMNDSIRIVSAELKNINNTLDSLCAELNDIEDSGSKRTITVQLDLRFGKSGPANVALTYIISNACWVPIYDARLNEIGDSVELTYFADIAQRTGEDWNDVAVELSTSTPSRGAGPGGFRQKGLSLSPPPAGACDIISPSALLRYQMREFRIRGGAGAESLYVVGKAPSKDPFGFLGDWADANIGHSRFSTQYTIDRSESIQSGGKIVRVQVGGWMLGATVAHICRPSTIPSVFRLAKIQNQETTPLLPGEVSLFVESDYVGAGFISELVAPRQSFDLPFGADGSVEVKREIIRQKMSRHGDKDRMERTVSINLINHSADACSLRVEEPILIGRDARLKVKMGNIDPEPSSMLAYGVVSWNITLATDQEKRLLVPYRIEYPAGLVVTGL